MRNAAANPEIRMLNRLPKFSSYPEDARRGNARTLRDTGGTRVESKFMFDNYCAYRWALSAAKFKITVTSVCRRFWAAVRQAMRLDCAKDATLGCGHCR